MFRMSRIASFLVALIILLSGCQGTATTTDTIATTIPLDTGVTPDPGSEIFSEPTRPIEPDRATSLAAPTLEVTIDAKVCSISEIQSLPFGVFNINLIIQNQNNLDSGYALLSLSKGMSLDDLKTWTMESIPDWINRLASERQATDGKTTRVFDLTQINPNYHGESIYLTCFYFEDGKRIRMEDFGPILVNK